MSTLLWQLSSVSLNTQDFYNKHQQELYNRFFILKFDFTHSLLVLHIIVVVDVCSHF